VGSPAPAGAALEQGEERRADVAPDACSGAYQERLLEAEGNLRDLALFSTAIDTMLRGVDLLRLTVAEITDHEGQVREEFVVRQQKTGRGTLVALSPSTRAALKRWIAQAHKVPWAPLFTGLRRGKDGALSTAQYRRLVKKRVGYARLDPTAYSSHSLRRTKAALVYEHTRNIEVVRELLGQTSVSATSAYLNVGKKRALEIAKQLEI
jgi:integrase